MSDIETEILTAALHVQKAVSGANEVLLATNGDANIRAMRDELRSIEDRLCGIAGGSVAAEARAHERVKGQTINAERKARRG